MYADYWKEEISICQAMCQEWTGVCFYLFTIFKVKSPNKVAFQITVEMGEFSS